VAETLTDTVAVVDVSNEVQTLTFTLDGSLMSADDLIALKLTRLASVDPPDTYTGAIAVIDRVQVRFKST